MVIAETNKILRFNDASSFIFPLMLNTLSNSFSDNNTNNPPTTKPRVGNNHTMYPKL